MALEFLKRLSKGKCKNQRVKLNFLSSQVGAVKVNVQLARLNYRAVKSKCKVIDQMQDKSESECKRLKASGKESQQQGQN